MPFPAGKSPQDAAQNVKNALGKITNEKLEVALITVAYAVGGNADFYVPVDTNALMNSRATKTIPHKGGHRAVISYGVEKKADYAAALHGSDTYSPLWKPVDPFEREWRQKSAKNFVGNGTGGWNPSARPGWIFMGVADTDVVGIFAEQMKV